MEVGEQASHFENIFRQSSDHSNDYGGAKKLVGWHSRAGRGRRKKCFFFSDSHSAELPAAVGNEKKR